MRYGFFAACLLGAVLTFPGFHAAHSSVYAAAFVILLLLSALGIWDLTQAKHGVLRNYPVLGHLRYILEFIRPELRQYFFESDIDGVPYNRSERALVYQRAKDQLDYRPFGTEQNAYRPSFEWLNHSLAPKPATTHDFRVTVGGRDCTQPYSLSLFNISAMSFGSLSANAIRALNKGARLGSFAHDTGEGGYSRHHHEFGGDIIWEIGSGYFSCRNEDGTFSPERFADLSRDPQVKMVEIKLSQGAKPGHGGVLPGPKVTAEIADARGVPIGKDCVSPAAHSAFSTPIEMMQFVRQLRELSGGKPVGFKLCIGQPWEFMGICKAMIATDIKPDFIVIDGTEGGTGAAPLEFVDHVGTPLREGLVFAHNCLVGAGLRDDIRLGAAGRIITGFDMARVLALGADWCNAGRGFMFALGCIQAQNCHTDRCPSGVATQDARRQRAIDVPDKAERVRRFHENTLKALADLIGAAGLTHPKDLTAAHVLRRVSEQEIKNFSQIYSFLAPGELLAGSKSKFYADTWATAHAEWFSKLPDVKALADAQGQNA